MFFPLTNHIFATIQSTTSTVHRWFWLWPGAAMVVLCISSFVIFFELHRMLRNTHSWTLTFHKQQTKTLTFQKLQQPVKFKQN